MITVGYESSHQLDLINRDVLYDGKEQMPPFLVGLRNSNLDSSIISPSVYIIARVLDLPNLQYTQLNVHMVVKHLQQRTRIWQCPKAINAAILIHLSSHEVKNFR